MVAPTGFYVVVLFVVYISFFAGGASPSPTKIEQNLIFVDSRFIRTTPPINQNLKSNNIIVVCGNKSHMHKYRLLPAEASRLGASRPKFEIKPRHRGVRKQKIKGVVTPLCFIQNDC